MFYRTLLFVNVVCYVGLQIIDLLITYTLFQVFLFVVTQIALILLHLFCSGFLLLICLHISALHFCIISFFLPPFPSFINLFPTLMSLHSSHCFDFSFYLCYKGSCAGVSVIQRPTLFFLTDSQKSLFPCCACHIVKSQQQWLYISYISFYWCKVNYRRWFDIKRLAIGCLGNTETRDQDSANVTQRGNKTERLV